MANTARNSDFYVEFGSNAKTFSDALPGELSGAKRAIASLRQDIQSLYDDTRGSTPSLGQGLISELREANNAVKGLATGIQAIGRELQTVVDKLSRTEIKIPVRYENASGTHVPASTQVPAETVASTRSRRPQKTTQSSADADRAEQEADNKGVEAARARKEAASRRGARAQKTTQAARDADRTEQAADDAELRREQERARAAQQRLNNARSGGTNVPTAQIDPAAELERALTALSEKQLQAFMRQYYGGSSGFSTPTGFHTPTRIIGDFMKTFEQRLARNIESGATQLLSQVEESFKAAKVRPEVNLRTAVQKLNESLTEAVTPPPAPTRAPAPAPRKQAAPPPPSSAQLSAAAAQARLEELRLTAVPTTSQLSDDKQLNRLAEATGFAGLGRKPNKNASDEARRKFNAAREQLQQRVQGRIQEMLDLAASGAAEAQRIADSVPPPVRAAGHAPQARLRGVGESVVHARTAEQWQKFLDDVNTPEGKPQSFEETMAKLGGLPALKAAGYKGTSLTPGRTVAGAREGQPSTTQKSLIDAIMKIQSGLSLAPDLAEVEKASEDLKKSLHADEQATTNASAAAGEHAAALEDLGAALRQDTTAVREQAAAVRETRVDPRSSAASLEEARTQLIQRLAAQRETSLRRARGDRRIEDPNIRAATAQAQAELMAARYVPGPEGITASVSAVRDRIIHEAVQGLSPEDAGSVARQVHDWSTPGFFKNITGIGTRRRGGVTPTGRTVEEYADQHTRAVQEALAAIPEPNENSARGRARLAQQALDDNVTAVNGYFNLLHDLTALELTPGFKEAAAVVGTRMRDLRTRGVGSVPRNNMVGFETGEQFRGEDKRLIPDPNVVGPEGQVPRDAEGNPLYPATVGDPRLMDRPEGRYVPGGPQAAGPMTQPGGPGTPIIRRPGDEPGFVGIPQRMVPASLGAYQNATKASAAAQRQVELAQQAVKELADQSAFYEQNPPRPVLPTESLPAAEHNEALQAEFRDAERIAEELRKAKRVLLDAEAAAKSTMQARVRAAEMLKAEIESGPVQSPLPLDLTPEDVGGGGLYGRTGMAITTPESTRGTVARPTETARGRRALSDVDLAVAEGRQYSQQQIEAMDRAEMQRRLREAQLPATGTTTDLQQRLSGLRRPGFGTQDRPLSAYDVVGKTLSAMDERTQSYLVEMLHHQPMMDLVSPQVPRELAVPPKRPGRGADDAEKDTYEQAREDYRRAQRAWTRLRDAAKVFDERLEEEAKFLESLPQELKGQHRQTLQSLYGNWDEMMAGVSQRQRLRQSLDTQNLESGGENRTDRSGRTVRVTSAQLDDRASRQAMNEFLMGYSPGLMSTGLDPTKTQYAPRNAAETQRFPNVTRRNFDNIMREFQSRLPEWAGGTAATTVETSAFAEGVTKIRELLYGKKVGRQFQTRGTVDAARKASDRAYQELEREAEAARKSGLDPTDTESMRNSAEGANFMRALQKFQRASANYDEKFAQLDELRRKVFGQPEEPVSKDVIDERLAASKEARAQADQAAHEKRLRTGVGYPTLEGAILADPRFSQLTSFDDEHGNTRTTRTGYYHDLLRRKSAAETIGQTLTPENQELMRQREETQMRLNEMADRQIEPGGLEQARQESQKLATRISAIDQTADPRTGLGPTAAGERARLAGLHDSLVARITETERAPEDPALWASLRAKIQELNEKIVSYTKTNLDELGETLKRNVTPENLTAEDAQAARNKVEEDLRRVGKEAAMARRPGPEGKDVPYGSVVAKQLEGLSFEQMEATYARLVAESAKVADNVERAVTATGAETAESEKLLALQRELAQAAAPSRRQNKRLFRGLAGAVMPEWSDEELQQKFTDMPERRRTQFLGEIGGHIRGLRPDSPMPEIVAQYQRFKQSANFAGYRPVGAANGDQDVLFGEDDPRAQRRTRTPQYQGDPYAYLAQLLRTRGAVGQEKWGTGPVNLEGIEQRSGIGASALIGRYTDAISRAVPEELRSLPEMTEAIKRVAGGLGEFVQGNRDPIRRRSTGEEPTAGDALYGPFQAADAEGVLRALGVAPTSTVPLYRKAGARSTLGLGEGEAPEVGRTYTIQPSAFGAEPGAISRASFASTNAGNTIYRLAAGAQALGIGGIGTPFTQEHIFGGQVRVTGISTDEKGRTVVDLEAVGGALEEVGKAAVRSREQIEAEIEALRAGMNARREEASATVRLTEAEAEHAAAAVRAYDAQTRNLELLARAQAIASGEAVPRNVAGRVRNQISDLLGEERTTGPITQDLIDRAHAHVTGENIDPRLVAAGRTMNAEREVPAGGFGECCEQIVGELRAIREVLEKGATAKNVVRRTSADPQRVVTADAQGNPVEETRDTRHVAAESRRVKVTALTEQQQALRDELEAAKGGAAGARDVTAIRRDLKNTTARLNSATQSLVTEQEQQLNDLKTAKTNRQGRPTSTTPPTPGVANDRQAVRDQLRQEAYARLPQSVRGILAPASLLPDPNPLQTAARAAIQYRRETGVTQPQATTAVAESLGYGRGTLERGQLRQAVTAEALAQDRLARETEKANKEKAKAAQSSERAETADSAYADVLQHLSAETQSLVAHLQHLNELKRTGQPFDPAELTRTQVAAYSAMNTQLTALQKQTPSGVLGPAFTAPQRAAATRSLLGNPPAGQFYNIQQQANAQQMVQTFTSGAIASAPQFQSNLMTALFGTSGVSGRAVAAAGHAASRFFGYGLVFGITNELQKVIRTATETQAEFVRISDALKANGRDAGNLRQQLASISSNLATPLEEVYVTASQLVGVFNNTSDVVFATKAVEELKLISRGALNAQEGITSLMAISETYGLTGGRAFQNIVDKMTAIQNVTGINVENLLEGAGGLASQASQYGFTGERGLTTAAVLAGTVAKRTNQSGTAAAEQLSRFFAAMGNSRAQETLLETGVATPQQLNQRDYAAIWQQILQRRASGQLTDQQAAAISNLGGPRQARPIAAGIGTRQEAQNTLDAIDRGNNSAGEGARRVTELMKQLNREAQRLSTNLSNLGTALVQGGLLGGVQVLLEVMNKLFQVTTKIGDALSFAASLPVLGQMLRLIKDIGVYWGTFFVTSKLIGATMGAIQQRAAAVRGQSGVAPVAPVPVPGVPGYFYHPGASTPTTGTRGVAAPVNRPAWLGSVGYATRPVGNFGRTFMASQAFVQAEQEALRAQVAIPTAPAGRLNPAVRLTSTAGYLGSRILDTPFLRLGRTLEATGRSGSILDRSTSAVGGKFVSMGRAMTTASTSMAALQDRIATLSASSRVAGFLMGGLNAALIGVPLVMMAMSAKAESARTLHDMRDSLFGDPKTKDNVDTTPGQKKITAAQQYYNQVHGQYHSTGAKAGGLLTEITSGAAGLLTGFGLTQTSRDLFNEAYQGAQQFTGSADEKMPADLLTHLQDVAIGGLKGLSNKTMDIQTLNDWVDKQSDAILNDSSLNDVQKAAGLQKVAEIQNMFQEGADAIKNRAKGLADINQLTDRQMSTYADVFSLAMSTGSGTLQKFGPGLFSTLVGQGGISDLSDSGQLLAKMLGVDTRASAQGQIDPKAVRKWLPWGTDRIVGPGEAVLPPTYQKGDPYPTSIVGRQGLEPGGAPVPGMGGNLRPKPQSLRTSLATPAGAIDTMVAARKVAEEQLTQAQTAFEDAAKNNVDRAVFDQKQKDYLDKFQAFTSIENAIAQAAQDAASQADALIRGGDLQGGLKLMDDAIAALKRSLKGMPQGKERRDAETALRDVEAGRAERAAAPGIGASQLAAAQSRDPVTQAQKNADAATKSLNMMLNAPKGAFTPDQINNARTAQAQALVQVDQANEAVANAAGQLLIAQTKDPFEKSRRSLADLRRQLAVAESHGDQAAVDQLKGQIIAAQQQADDLASQAVQAHYSLLEAIATAAGHTVQAAQLGLQAAQANYEKVLKANGGNTRAPDVQNAKAAVVTARANVRDTWLQDRESDLKFNYDMGKISLQMYQQQLKDLLRRRDLTKQQRQEIQRTLHDLSSANQGMWNIGDIKTPTIYEARRFSQNQAAGLDYRARPQYVGAAQAASTATNNVTNNNQTNNFNINGADTAAVMRVIQSVVGAQTSQRNTTTTRRQ